MANVKEAPRQIQNERSKVPGMAVKGSDGASTGLDVKELRNLVPTDNPNAGKEVTIVWGTLPNTVKPEAQPDKEANTFDKVLQAHRAQGKKRGGDDPEHRIETPGDGEPIWTKAFNSFSNNNCVELAMLERNVRGIRDSKNKMGPIIRVSPNSLNTFLDSIRQGQFSN